MTRDAKALALSFLFASLAFAQKSSTPTIAGVSNTASGTPRLARGSLASIYGSDLSTVIASASTLPLPVMLNNVQVNVGGIPAPLIYISPGQINIQIPFDAPAGSSLDVVVVRDGSSSALFRVPQDENVPGIFQYARTASTLDPIIVHGATNQLVTPASPAAPNETLVIYATGIGQLTNPPRSGLPSPSSPPSMAIPEVTVTAGGPATVTFAGLTPGLIGLIQINARLGSSLPSGSCTPLVARVGGVPSQTVNLATGPGECAAPPAAIVVTPVSLDFGSVTAGQTSTRTFSVQNTGSGALNVTSFTSANPTFTVTAPSVPFSVQPGGQQQVTVQFAPTGAGSQSGVLTIASNDPTRPSTIVALSGIGTAPVGPALTFSPAALDFDAVAVGQSKVISLALRNTGTTALTINSISSSDARFTISSLALPAQLAAGAQSSVDVIFTPTGPGAYSGNLSILSTDTARPAASVPLTGTGAAPALSLLQTILEFGNVVIGGSKEVTISAQNSGTAPLIITGVATSNALFTTSGFTLPVVLQPKAQAIFTVKFTPATTGQQSGTIAFQSNDPARPRVEALLNATGISGAPNMTLDPTTVDFETVQIGTTTDLPLTITNAGTTPLLIRDILPAQSITVNVLQRAPITVAPGAQTVLTVRFTPTAVGAVNDAFFLDTNDPNNSFRRVPVKGNAIPVQ